MLPDRVIERFRDFKKAFFRLKKASELEDNSDILVDAVIQRFEFAFELSWKFMKSYLEYEGIEGAASPRSTIRLAFKQGLITDGDDWITMMLDRNRTSHVYDEKLALEIFNNIKDRHIKLLNMLVVKFETILS